MNRPDRSPVTTWASRKFTRGSLALTAAVLIVLGALLFALWQDTRFAFAEPAQPAQTLQTSLGTAPLGFADLVQKVTPAVVSVQVKAETEVDEDDVQVPGLPDLPEDNPLNKFFKEFKKRYGQHDPNGKQNPAKPHPMMAQGSGFFISSDGYIVTNNAVVRNAKSVVVTMMDGKTLDAEVVGSDARTGIALQIGRAHV